MLERLKHIRRKPGMPVSLGLHAAVLVASIVSFSSPKKFDDATEAIPVEMMSETALAQMMKGEANAKPQPVPTPRVDRVSDKREQNAPGAAARQVNAAETPKPQEATAKEEKPETTAAVTVPLPPVRPQPPKPVEPVKVAEPPKPVEPPKPAEPPKAIIPAAKPPKPAEPEEDEEAEEAIRQAAKKREEQKKLDDARRAEEARKRDEQRKAEEAKRLEEKRQDEARRIEEVKRQEEKRQEERKAEEARRLDAQKQEERREQEEARKRDEMKKLIEAKAAEAKKAEEAKKAQEAARKAAEEKKRREAEQEARNQATVDAARRALLASREVPQNAGNTGQQVTRSPSLGAPTATGQKLSPSDRAALAGLLSDQIRACWSIPVTGKPPVLPQVRVALNADGSLGATPVLINNSGDPNFRALAESGMRAIRQCAPFRIPSRYAATYDDWRQLAVQLNPDD
jgi:colicin import membrane protein